jgi:ribulose-5-phosphate 4-epimerase/fuculose-1-phosphate aldolase
MDLALPADRLAFEALARLERKGLAGAPSDTFSARIPGESALALASSGARSVAARVVRFEAVAREDAAAARHAAVYRVRPDAGAVLTARMPWASRLAQLRETMPAVVDEQARQLGPQVDRLGAALRGPGDTAKLERGANAFLLGDEVLVVGATPERAALNAELLEKCAKAYVLARATGSRIHRIPWLVRFVANRRLRKDERRAAAAFARGEMPARTSTY